MKKLAVFFVALFVGMISVNAISSSDLEAKLSKKYVINGSRFEATDAQKNVIRSYVKQYKLSDEDAEYISKKIDVVMDILKASGKKSFYNLSSADKKKIIDIVADVTANTSVKLAIAKKYLVIYKPGTNEVFHKEPIYPRENGDIEQTNRSLSIAVAGLISLAGLAVAVKKIKNA